MSSGNHQRVELSPTALMQTYLVDVAQHGRLELIEQLAHEDMVDEANQAFGGPAGRAGLAAHVTGFRRAIGNLQVSIDRIVGGTEDVMAWWSFSGEHVGPWLGRPPTGEAISGTVFSFFDLVDGKVSRYRVWLHAVFADGHVVFDSTPEGPPA